jgi:hypothetical protein
VIPLKVEDRADEGGERRNREGDRRGSCQARRPWNEDVGRGEEHATRADVEGRAQGPETFGHEWLIGHAIEEVSPEEMQRSYTALLR